MSQLAKGVSFEKANPLESDPAITRANLFSVWASVAPAWAEHADYVDARVIDVTTAIIGLVDPQPGERLLELAGGPGGTGLAAAARVGRTGAAARSDVAEEMTRIASARAVAPQARNIVTRVLDHEQVAQPDAQYDIILCREGLMFALDPVVAARGMARLLRPGGRLAVAVWGPRDRNPWLGLVFEAISAQIGRTLPQPGMLSPFALANSDSLAAVLGAGGLVGVVIRRLAVEMRAPSFDIWWARTSALAGPLTNILAAIPPSGLDELRDRLRHAVEPYRTGNGLAFPGETLLATAGRAASARYHTPAPCHGQL